MRRDGGRTATAVAPRQGGLRSFDHHPPQNLSALGPPARGIVHPWVPHRGRRGSLKLGRPRLNASVVRID